MRIRDVLDAASQYWRDNGTKKFDYWFVNPLTCIPIYDRSTVKKRLMYLLRAYAYNDNSGKPVTRYEVWSDTQVAYLIKPEEHGSVKAIINFEVLPDGSWNIQPHDYGRIPFIEFRNNAHADNDLIMYKDIIDALDKLVSGFANDCDDIQEVIWVLKNYNGEKEVPVYDKDGKEVTDSDGNPAMRPVDVPQMLKPKRKMRRLSLTGRPSARRSRKNRPTGKRICSISSGSRRARRGRRNRPVGRNQTEMMAVPHEQLLGTARH